MPHDGQRGQSALWWVAAAVWCVGGADAGDCLHGAVATRYTGGVVLRSTTMRASTADKKGFYTHPVFMGNDSCAYEGQAAFNPLGSAAVTCTQADVRNLQDNDLLRTLLDETIPRAASVLRDTFRVTPQAPQLTLHSQGGLHYPNNQYVAGAPDSCGHVQVRGTWVHDELNKRLGSTVLPTRADDAAAGVDLVLLVTLLPLPAAQRNTPSWGGVCVVDQDAGLPRLAFLNVNPLFLGRSEQRRLERAVVHDLLHIMGFSSMYWSQGWGADRHPSLRDMSAPLAFVRANTGCATAGNDDAAWLLEDSEASSLQNHWEKKLFNTEVMAQYSTALDGGNPAALSRLTLGYFNALNNDTTSPLPTSYVAVYDTHLQDLVWGKGKGCGFFRECAAVAGNDTYAEFCNPLASGSKSSPAALQAQGGGTKLRCTYTGGAKGSCDAAVQASPPTGFTSVFDVANYGSADIEMNFCPVVRAAKVCSDKAEHWSRDSLIEAYGVGSRCVESDDIGAVCVKSCCAWSDYYPAGTWNLYITVPTSQASGTTATETLLCSGDGTEGNVTTAAWGTLVCPAADVVCAANAASGASHATGIRSMTITPYGGLNGDDLAAGFTPADRSVLSYPTIPLLFEVELSVPLQGEFNLTVLFPTGRGWTHGDGDVLIELLFPGYRGAAPVVTPTTVLAGVFANGLLTVSKALESLNYSFAVQPCDAFVFVAHNFTSPPGFGHESIIPSDYRVVVASNGTTFDAALVDAEGDELPYPNVTLTGSASADVTPSQTLSATASPTSTETASATATDTPTPPPPTVTKVYSRTVSESLTVIPDLPCYCYGRGNCVTDAGARTTRCFCEEGFTGRFCQVESCGRKPCGRWGECVGLLPNRTTAYEHVWGSQGYAGGDYAPHPWLVELDTTTQQRFRAPYHLALQVNTTYPSPGAEAAFFTEKTWVDGLGWYKLCPDTDALQEVDLHTLTLEDVKGDAFLEEPYDCVSLWEAFADDAPPDAVAAAAGRRAERLVEVGDGVYNVSLTWVEPGVFAVFVNQSDVSEEAAGPYEGDGFRRVRLLFAADYASQEHTAVGVEDVDVGIEVDGSRLEEDDPYRAFYGEKQADLSTPYKRRATVAYNEDLSGRSPFVSVTVVPGSVLEWASLPADEPTLATARMLPRKDVQFVLGAALWSQHVFVTFAEPRLRPRARDTLNYAMQNLYNRRGFECMCPTNSTQGLVYVDPHDAICRTCAAVVPDGPAAFPPGDCTRVCDCRSGGQCDVGGVCGCAQNFTGPQCEYCTPDHYPDTRCDTYCNAEVTCLGRGSCNGYGQCVCRPGFAGQRCERRACSDNAVQCNGLGKCHANAEPFDAFREAQRFGVADPGLWQDPNPPFHRVNDWDAGTGMWLDGGEDTFDGWGNFSVCTATDGCRPLHGINRGFHDVRPQAVRCNRTTGVLWAGWINHAVFVLTIEVDEGEPAWLEFGGSYGGAFQEADSSDEIAFGGLDVSIRVRHVSLRGVRQGVAYGIARPTGQSRIFEEMILKSTRTGPQAERVATPPVRPGDGAPLSLLVHWGELGAERLSMVRELTGLCSAVVTTAYCEECGVRGGTWCDRCALRAYPAPRLLTYPPNHLSGVPHGADASACNRTCECVGIDEDVMCSESGACQCTGHRSGSKCETCAPEFYVWPACSTQCHSLFTCSGRGVCDVNGKCACFFGYSGFSCQRSACEATSCGTAWNNGNSICSAPVNSAYKRLWYFGVKDDRNDEFTLPLLRGVKHGRVELVVGKSLLSDIPRSIAGPDLAVDTQDGLTAGEFNPLTVVFDLPLQNITGACWTTPDQGTPYYDHSVNSSAGCGGRWDEAILCYSPATRSYLVHSPACPAPLEVVRFFANTSEYVVTFAMTTRSTSPVVVYYYLNSYLVATQDSNTLGLDVSLPYDRLLWGMPNHITAKVERGADVAIDSLSMHIVARGSAQSTDTGTHAYYTSPQHDVKPNFAKMPPLNPAFKLQPDLIEEVAQSSRYFAEGPGLWTVASGALRRTKIFDKYGFFRMCIRSAVSCTNLLVSGTTAELVWPFTLGGLRWEARSRFSDGLLSLNVEQQDSPETPVPFYVLFGGTYANTSTPRTYEASARDFVIHNYPVRSEMLANFEGTVDVFGGSGSPQLHVVVIPPHNEPASRVVVSVEHSLQKDLPGKLGYTLQERILVDNIVRSATIILQWGFSTKMALLRHIFGSFGSDEAVTCVCKPPFTGVNCDRCSKVACDVPQCYDKTACATCPYPLSGAACGECLAGFQVPRIPGAAQCEATCPAVNNCSVRGTCALPDVCECFDGFYGVTCDRQAACLSECVGSSHFTNCTAVKCFPADRSGLNIQVDLCPWRCHRGTCSAATRRCVCDPGWSGEDCTSPECGGGLRCFGHGVCTLPNACVCSDGWEGVFCESSPCQAYSTCHSCIGTPGCGWCAATGECLPEDNTGAAFTNAGQQHACKAANGLFMRSECHLGYWDEGWTLATRFPTVNYINCSAVCQWGGDALCEECAVLVPPPFRAPGEPIPGGVGDGDSDGGGLQSMASSRRLLQAPAVGGTRTGTVSLTATDSRSWTVTASLSTTVTPVRTCGQIFSRPWMPTALIANYVCACEQSQANNRDAQGDCMIARVDLHLQLPLTLATTAATKRTEFEADKAALSKEVQCCKEQQVCCNNTRLNDIELRTLAYVNWYVAEVVPVHTQAYDDARRSCGCDVSCLNHQRDGIWWVLIQQETACQKGALPSVLLHPCQLAITKAIDDLLPAPYRPPRCPLLARETLVPLPIANNAAEERRLVSTLPTCLHWVRPLGSPALWTCCNEAHRCYASCASVAACTARLVRCVNAHYTCAALLGVKQLMVEEPYEESLAWLALAVLTTTSHSKQLRTKGCVCRYSEASRSDPFFMQPVANGLNINGTAVCFDGFLFNEKTRSCDVTNCDCSGNGVCVRDKHRRSSCKCSAGWQGASCELPVFSYASAFGLGHVTTWDGATYQHYGSGPYTLFTTHIVSTGAPVVAQIYKTFIPSRGVSITHGFAVAYENITVSVYVKQDSRCGEVNRTRTAAAPPLGAGGPPLRRCAPAALEVFVNGQPYAGRDYAWAFQRYTVATGGVASEVLVYSMETGAQTTVFVQGRYMKAKIGVVWSAVLQMFYFDVHMSVCIVEMPTTEGLFSSNDANKTNDFQARKPNGVATKAVWSDYHDFGELLRASADGIIPLYLASDQSPFPAPVGHTYYLSPDTAPPSPLCAGLSDPAVRAACNADAGALLEASEYYFAHAHCNGPDRDFHCFVSGVCIGPDACACPFPLNATAHCVLSSAIPAGIGREEGTQRCSSLNDCSGRGACEVLPTPHCVCHAGWGGDRCLVPECAACVHGECGERPSGDAGCVCDPGFGGAACDEPLRCPELWDCNGHGLCSEGSVCKCHTGWVGDTCNAEVAVSGVCPAGFTGRWCTVPDCACSGHGACSVATGTPQCLCATNWYDAQCNVRCEADIECTGHGVCSSLGVCVCTPPYRTSTCDIVNPTIAKQYLLILKDEPPMHPQGIDLRLQALIDSATVLPPDHVLRWSSSPDGLFALSTENQMSVEAAGASFVCNARASFGVEDVLRRCTYTIFVKLFSGVFEVSSTQFTLEVLRAPVYRSGMGFSGGVRQGDLLRIEEVSGVLTADAGLWTSETPPNVYRFEARLSTGDVIPVVVDGTFDYQIKPVVTFKAPLLPCSVKSQNATMQLFVYVRSRGAAVASRLVNQTLPLYVTRKETAAILPYLRLVNATTTGPDMMALTASLLSQRLPPPSWEWAIVVRLLNGLQSLVRREGDARGFFHSPSAYRILILDALVEMVRMSRFPTSTPTCGIIASPEEAVSNAVLYADRIAYLNSKIDTVLKIELNTMTLESEISTALLDSASKVVDAAARLRYYEAILLRTGDTSLSASTVVVARYPAAKAQKSYVVEDAVLYTMPSFPLPGLDLIAASINPGTERSFTSHRVNETATAEAGVVTTTPYSVLLESNIISLQMRDPSTQRYARALGLSDIGIVTFSLDRGIDYARSYNCVYWDGEWLWGPQVGVSRVQPVTRFSEPIIVAKNRQLTYGCPVTHFSMYALAFIQQSDIASGTAAPTTPEPPVLPPVDGGGVFDVPKKDPGGSTASSTIAISAIGGVLLVAVVIVIGRSCQKRRRRRKKSSADETGMFARISNAAKGMTQLRRTADREKRKVEEARRKEADRNYFSNVTYKAGGIVAQETQRTKLPEQPENVMEDAYLAQREMDVIQQVVNLQDLQDPAKTIGTSVYVYPIKGDSESDKSSNAEAAAEEGEAGDRPSEHFRFGDAEGAPAGAGGGGGEAEPSLAAKLAEQDLQERQQNMAAMRQRDANRQSRRKSMQGDGAADNDE